MVMAQSLFITLKQRSPNSSIDVLAPAWSGPLLARMPEVNEALDMPLRHGEVGIQQRRVLGQRLKTKRYSQAIVLPRSLKAALVPFFAGISQRTGYRGEMRYGLINDMRALDKQILTQTVQRFVALGLPDDTPLPPSVIPQPRLSISKDNRAHLLRDLRLETTKPVVAFMPGAEYGPAKRWPAAYYAELARLLLTERKQIWIFGSAGDEELAAGICASAGPGCVNLCGRTRLEDAIDLLSLASQAITNDSGLMHVAAALGIQLIALYGSSSPAYTPPLSAQADIVYLDLWCSPCFQRECPLGHRNCLRHIRVDEIHRRCTEAGVR